MLITVRTVLLTLLRTVHGQTTTTAKDTTANHPHRAVAIRSGRATNGDEVKHRENGLADRHHPLTVVEVRLAQTRRDDKKRQKAAMNLPLFAALTG